MSDIYPDSVPTVPVVFIAENNHMTVRLRSGRLPYATASSLLKTLVAESKRGDYRVLSIDFRELDQASSPILGLCVDIRNRAVARGLSVEMIGVNSQLHEMFKLMRLDRLFHIVPASESSIAA